MDKIKFLSWKFLSPNSSYIFHSGVNIRKYSKLYFAQKMDNNRPDIKDRMLGCLYGQAIGDALGLGTEFMTKEEVSKYYPNELRRYDEIIQDDKRGLDR